MAKYNVTYSCGHSDTIQLYGPHKERDRKIEYFEQQGTCSDCYRKERAADGPMFSVCVHRSRGVQLACYRNTYPIKDQLKAEGYRYCESVYNPVPRGYDGKGWQTDWISDRAVAESAIKWVVAQGWSFATTDNMHPVVARIVAEAQAETEAIRS